MKNASAFPLSALCAALLCASCGNDRGAPAAESAEAVQAPAATADTDNFDICRIYISMNNIDTNYIL